MLRFGRMGTHRRGWGSRVRHRNPAGALLMVNPTRRKKRVKNARKKRKTFSKPKALKKRRNPMAKSRRRSRAAKLAWRRKRNPIRRKRRASNPIRRRRRRRNPWYRTMADGTQVPAGPHTRGAKFVSWGRSKRVGWSRKKHLYGYKKTKRRSKSAPKRRRRTYTKKGAARRRKYGKSRTYRAARRRHYGSHRRGGVVYMYPPRRKTRSRSKIMKLAWRRRRHGAMQRGPGRRRRRYITRAGRRYKQASMHGRHHFSFWRNPGLNMAALKEVALPVGLALAGILAAAFLVKKINTQTWSAQIPTVAGFKLTGLIPAVVGIAGIALLAKKMPAQAGMIKGLGFGLMLASGAMVWNQLIAPKISKTPGDISVSFGGYVTESMEGYVRSPLAGYVRSLGQLDEGFQHSLGESVQYRGELAPLGVPSDRALDYETATVKPYGLGLPAEERRYNDFAWRGVYARGVYEGK